MKYIYETHLHTIEASACSRTPAKDYIDHMMNLGYSGMIVTDHFFTGNSCVPKDLPWEERVDIYCSGYEHALEAAKGHDFTVMFGIEFNFQGDEFMIYGVDKKWLKDHPEIMEISRRGLYDLVHEAGGIMLQAHPYRERGYLSAIHISPTIGDGAEVFNAGNEDYMNALAYDYAIKNNFRMASGSDIHFPMDDMGGMSFPYKINSIEEYVKAFLAGDGTPVFWKDVTHTDTGFLPVDTEKSLTEISQGPTLEVITHNE
ncbi:MULTISPECIES: PHP domain-containing protein [unclassified Butyrivibrio]|uniref:PHP domain-containing protein n=1 Tax=unclassified Butyrivibrio TaxID=2639466 RepID=UPI00040BE9CC|nr:MULTISPECIES: PHP domain-containing protein [unclassified Butyrivibrio]